MTALRTRCERLFHDAQARSRAATFDRHPHRLRFTDDEYLDHETWVRPAFAALGDVAGRRVLDFGCGHGMAAVVLARRGANVTAFDLSPGYVAEAKRRAAANNVWIDIIAADGHTLPFADRSFDAVWGHAVLHHLDVAIAAGEIRRVLRPGGIAVFCEPWAGNPFVRAARRWLPYAGKHRTADESPLGETDVVLLRREFPGLTVTGSQLIAGLSRVTRARRSLERIDAAMFAMAPLLRRWGRYAVLTLR